MRNPLFRKRCDHCRRDDLGTRDAGRAIVKVNITNPFDRSEVLAIVTLIVCCPTARYRPRCDVLVRIYGHGRECPTCFEYNPPGAELLAAHASGRWAD